MIASEHNQVMFKVARHATKPQIKEAVEKLFDVKVKAVDQLAQRQGQGIQGHRWRAVGGQTRRDFGGGSPDRCDHGPVRKRRNGTQNPTTQSRRASVSSSWSIVPGFIASAGGEGAHRGQELERRPKQQRSHHRALSAAAATRRPTARSISGGANSMCPRKSSASNMIPIAPASLR